MKFSKYQKLVADMPLYDDVALGLPGEVGEVLELVKKDRRPGDRRQPMNREKLIGEAGDVLWYLTMLCNHYGVGIDEVAEYNINKLTKRHST